MESIRNNAEKSGKRNYLKRIFFVFLILYTSFLIAILIFVALAPNCKIKELQKLNYQDEQVENYELTNYDDNVFQLRKQEAFLKSRLAMSESDSINLSLNLSDSTLSLEIKGVVIYSIKIEKIRLSPIYSRIDNKALINYFSTPFSIDYQYATIVKEPVIVKKAPKDTIEANQTVPSIDTLKPKMVAYYFYLDKDILLDIRQSENASLIPFLRYSMNYSFWKTKSQLNKVFRLNIPCYLPWIQIEINSKDALALYRALPYNALITIHI
jgi:hypothetical protein